MEHLVYNTRSPCRPKIAADSIKRRQVTRQRKSPTGNRLESQIHASLRLHRDDALNTRFLLGVQLNLELANDTRDGTPQLGLGKVTPNAGPRPVEKRQLRKVGRRAARLVRPQGAVVCLVDPPLRHDHVRVLPEVGAPVDSVGDEQEVGALGDVIPGNGGVVDGFSDGGRYGGVEAEGLLAHAVEVGHALQQV